MLRRALKLERLANRREAQGNTTEAGRLRKVAYALRQAVFGEGDTTLLRKLADNMLKENED